jgi:hypothetical protein
MLLRARAVQFGYLTEQVKKVTVAKPGAQEQQRAAPEDFRERAAKRL